jgi:hypothetical protein
MWRAARQVEFNCVHMHTIQLRFPHPRQSFEDRVDWPGAPGRRDQGVQLMLIWGRPQRLYVYACDSANPVGLDHLVPQA